MSADLSIHGVTNINVSSIRVVGHGTASRDIIIETPNATFCITVYCKADEDEEEVPAIQIKL